MRETKEGGQSPNGEQSHPQKLICENSCWVRELPGVRNRLRGEVRIHGLRRRAGAKKPLPTVLAGLQLNCQNFSATATNPGLIPVDTNANLRL